MASSTRATRDRSRILRRLAGLVLAFVGVLAVVAVLAVLVPNAAIFAPLRASIVATALAATFGSPVHIDGPVAFELGSTVHVTASRIVVERPDGAAADEPDRIDRGTVGFSLGELLTGRFDLTSLALDGVAMATNSPVVGIDPDAPMDDRAAFRWIGILPATIRLAQHIDVAVKDVTYLYSNAANGWVFDVAIDTISSARSANGDTKIAVSGRVNNTPVSIDGTIEPSGPGTPDGGTFTLALTTKGSTIAIRSAVPEETDTVLREIAVDIEVGSIGDMLETFRVARSVEGTGKLTASIETQQHVSSLRDLAVSAAFQNGPQLSLAGSVADLVARRGFDLTVNTVWPEPSAEPEDGLLDFELHSISARLTGDLSALQMDDGWITTNLFADAIPSLGPITAAAVRREDDGRIALEGLHVLAGPSQARTFDLDGRIGDLLQLKDFSLSGKLSVPTEQMIDLEIAAPGALGRLTGDFAVSDASGQAGIDTFAARLTGSDVVSADVSLKADQTQPVKTATFSISMNVPDYDKLAMALGVATQSVGAISYAGDLTLMPGSGSAIGHLQFGNMDVTGNMSVKSEGGRPMISGTVTSPTVSLPEVKQAVAIGRAFASLRKRAQAPAAAPAGGSARTPEFTLGHPRFEVDVTAGTVEAAGTEVTSLTGQITYDQGVLGADSLVLSYGRGRFHVDGQMRVIEPERPFSVNGRAAGFSLADVMRELAIDLPVVGMLEADFNIDSHGTTLQVATAAAKGDVYLRLTGGSIGNRLLDLSGLDLPQWLLAPSAKTNTSRIECFSAKLDFQPGLAVLQSAVVETDEVRVTATGRIDFKDDTIDIEATPKALHPNFIPLVSPFAIRGSLSQPKVVVEGGMVGRGIAETLALPFNTLGALLRVDSSGPKPRKVSNAC